MPSWCHCHSLSLASVKSRLVLLFWYRLTRVVPDIGLLNGCVCTEKNEREKTKNQSLTAFLTHSQKRRPAFNRYLYEQFTKSVCISKIFLYKTVPSFVSNVLNRLELTSSPTSAVPGATERENDKETETDCRSMKPCSQRRTELNWTELTCSELTQLHDPLLVTRVSVTKLIGCRAAVCELQFANWSHIAGQFSSIRRREHGLSFLTLCVHDPVVNRNKTIQ